MYNIIKVSSLFKDQNGFNQDISYAVSLSQMMGLSITKFTLQNDIGELGELYDGAEFEVELMKSGNYSPHVIDLNCSKCIKNKGIKLNRAVVVKVCHVLNRSINTFIDDLYIYNNEPFQVFKFFIHDNFVQDVYRYVSIQRLHVFTMEDLERIHLELKDIYLYKSDRKTFIDVPVDRITYHYNSDTVVHENKFIPVAKFSSFYRRALKYLNQGYDAFGIAFILANVRMYPSSTDRYQYNVEFKCLDKTAVAELPSASLALEMGSTIAEDLYHSYIEHGGISEVKSRRDLVEDTFEEDVLSSKIIAIEE